MASKSSFNKTAIKVFNTFGDLIENVTYTIVGAWNPVTETTTNTTEAIRISVSPVKKEEADGEQIMIGDMMALIIVSEMTATPKIDDFLTFGGADYVVRAVEDNHTITWKLLLRRL